MKKLSLKLKTDLELTKLLLEKRRQLREFRFGAAGSRVRDTREGRHLRRDVARLMTEIRMRKLAATPAVSASDTVKVSVTSETK